MVMEKVENEHGQGAQPHAPPAGKFPFLTPRHLPARRQQHDQGHGPHKSQMDMGEQDLEHHADEQQLHRCAQGGDDDLANHPQLHAP